MLLGLVVLYDWKRGRHAEYFAETTRLRILLRLLDTTVSVPGRYILCLEHILVWRGR